MDRALANAIKRQSELRRELAEIERFIVLYERFKGDSDPDQGALPLAKLIPVSPIAFDSGHMVPEIQSKEEHHPDLKPSNAPARGLSRFELAPIIEAEIRAAGRPLTRGQILRKLDARGPIVGGNADRAKNMGTILWRLRDTFVSLPNLGYWLRDTPYPPANYDPNDPNSPENIERVLG